MGPNYPNLFSPIRIRKHLFKNRIISAPLGAWVFSPDNYIYDYAISLFEEKARGGAAAVTLGHTEINYRDDDTDGFGLYFDLRKNEGTGALSEFAAAIQQYGAHASIELNYGGICHYIPKESDFSDKYDPGAYPPPVDSVFSNQKQTYGICSFNSPFGFIPGMPAEKIKSVIADFVKCVRKMRQCGYHMVTIHGAHGWLPAQFLSPLFNRRKDEYGGRLENRMRFPLELMRAVREAAGDEMIVEYRLSGIDPAEDKTGFDELVTFCNSLEGLADIIHVSAGGTSRNSMNRTFPSYLDPRGVNRGLAQPLKKQVKNIPIAVVGSISQPETAEAFIRDGVCDFVAMCRTLIADPHWPNKARRGQEEDIIPCIACYHCLDEMHKSHFLGCNVNPRSGREHRVAPLTKADVKKTVAVIGGGPAGMQAAITAADRGHDVTLYEKSSRLGGLLKIAENNQIKWMLNAYKDYLIRQVEKRRIAVKLNTAATKELMNDFAPQAIIVASGSEPAVPKIPGADGANVFTCVTAHEQPEKLGSNIVVVGGNLAGCETALYLKSIGKTSVTVVEMTDRLHADCGELVGYSLSGHMERAKIVTITEAKCTEISMENVTVQKKDGSEKKLPCDCVILAAGMVSRYDVFEDLLDCSPDVIPIGDCVTPGTVMNASRDGYYAARNL